MKRTLMLKNQEVLDFEVEPVSGNAHVLDAPDEGDETLVSLGLGGPDLDAVLTQLVSNRRLSNNREDLSEILDAFGVRSSIELALRGHALSLTDQFWYRASGSAERWEGLNFFDNDWDDSFYAAALSGDYSGLASCSPDVPDVTTLGHLRKAWERNDQGIFLVKRSKREDGVDLEGALLAANLCALLYGQDAYQRLSVERRQGTFVSVSPLMLSRDEELLNGRRLFAICGIDRNKMDKFMGPATPHMIIDVLSRAGVADAVAQAAKMFAFKALSLLSDLHTGNYGVIRNLETDVRRATPPFDYDRAFGFPSDGYPIEAMCANPEFAMLLCAQSFSDLDSSWDWGWYDPHALEGFEERIVETYAPYSDLPSNFGELVARLFVMQRSYVDDIASK